KASEMRYTYLPLDGRTDDKGADTDGQLAQLDIRAFGRDSIIRRRYNADPATDTFSLYPQDNEFGTFSHRVDQIGEAAEKFKPLFGRFDRQQFVERGACAKGPVAARAKNDHPRVAVIARAMDLMRNRLE